MDTNRAAEHLQTIRTLMERSALYRRALAPVSTFVGAVGILAAIAGSALKIQREWAFAIYWMVIAVVAIAGSLLLVRKQAMKDGEAFWSPPLRRVTQAMIPPLFVGLVFGLVIACWGMPGTFILAPWVLCFGLALHAAGFFMPRGIRFFGWWFILAGISLLSGSTTMHPWTESDVLPNIFMGIIFGASHLAFGIYLYFTERKNEA